MPAPAAPPAMPPGPPRLRLDNKVLSLEFRLLDAQFNEPGRYQLHLLVENPLLDDSVQGVTVQINNGDMLQSNRADTDIAEQTDLTDTLTFQKNTFLFVLPKGLCKNDKHHDVRLSIDVLKFGKGPLKSSKKVGQALFAIYPRTNQPRINLRAAPFEPLYNYQGVLALLRVGGDHMAMHCGRLAYNVCFREYQPPKIEEIPDSATPIPTSQKTGGSQPGTPRTDQQVPHSNSSLRVPSDRSIVSQPDTTRSNPAQTDFSTSRSQPSIPATPSHHNLSSHELSDEETEEEEYQSPRRYNQVNQEDSEDETRRTPLAYGGPQKTPLEGPLVFPPPPKTPAPNKKTHVKEKPPAHGAPVHGSEKPNKHLPVQGTEKILVTLHSAHNLPLNRARAVPCPFATLMSSADEKKGAGAQSVSHAAQSPTNSPVWGETLSMTIREEEAEKEELILTLADNPSQEFLLDYRLPLHTLQPFHPYHLCFLQPLDENRGKSHLYVSIERRSSSIIQQSGFTYSALQVLLVGVESPLKDHALPLLAVARVVPNYKDYSLAHKPPGMSGVPQVTVTFPDPAPSSFQVPHTATQGHPQISSPGLPPSQPIWNSSFLFQGRDGVTLFSEGAALVIEYYPVTPESRLVPWHLSDYCGFSVIPLDMEVYHKLMSGNSSNGLTLTSIPIQGTELQTVSGRPPSVSLQLLLLKSEHPEFFLSPSEMQPSNDLHGSTNTKEGPETHGTLPLQKDGPPFPSYNALADILPDPWLQQTPRDQKPADTARLQKQPNTDFNHLSNNVELPGDHVMEHQEQELANYRLAMQRMADDIIALRRQMSGLEAENSALRSERSMHQDLGRSLLSDTDIDVMTKAELADRLVTLKQKLASETSELRTMRDRVQQLQNELVRRNDREKELLLLQRAHQQQQAVLSQYHQRLARAKALQDTVRKQEKVIEKMERLLDNKLREQKTSRADGADKGTRVEALQGEVYSALLAENSRLREELEKAQHPATVMTHIQPVLVQDPFTDSEKFSLLGKLERLQARVQSLERELEEAARRWGRDKQQLMTQISEQKMGFSRTQTTILHHFPTKEPRPLTKRQIKLDPLR